MFKARSHCVLWPAQFGRKLVLGTRRKWPRPRRLPIETETLTIFLETRPRRDVGTSRDRLETETTTLRLNSSRYRNACRTARL